MHWRPCETLEYHLKLGGSDQIEWYMLEKRDALLYQVVSLRDVNGAVAGQIPYTHEDNNPLLPS